MWINTEDLNFANALMPADYNASATPYPCLVVNSAKYSSAVAILHMGAMVSCCKAYVLCASTAATISSNVAATTGTLFPFHFRLGATTGTAIALSTMDLLTARDTTATSGVVAYDSTASYASTGLGIYLATTQANANVYIEVKADDLPAGKPYWAVLVSTPAQSEIFGVTYVLKPRYPQFTMMPSAT